MENMNVKQKDVDEYIKNILINLDYNHVKYLDFLQDNYNILKKKYNTSLEMLIIKQIEKNELRYRAPEIIRLYVETIAFYMALEHFKIPVEKW
jgi:hypothetical protein